MAQEKNNIFGTISKKNSDGIKNIPVDISRLTQQIKEFGFSTAMITQDMIKVVVEEIMKQEMAEFLNADKSKRTSERKGYRNGSYLRTLVTTVGKLKLQVPRDRNGEFQTQVFERFSRSEKGLCSVIMEMYLKGISTRKVSQITEMLCGTSFSHTTVSNIIKELQPQVDKFKARPIVGRHKYVHIDAMYIKVRENNTTKDKALYIALGYNDDGRKTILGYEIANSENRYEYRGFLEYLKGKGLIEPDLFITDNNSPLKNAIEDVFGKDVKWQYCAAHLFRNTMNATANKYKKGLSILLKEFKHKTDFPSANKFALELTGFLQEKKQFSALKTFDNSYQYCLEYTNFNEEIHRCIFTNNALERVNGAVRQREKIIKIFPNVASVNRLVGCILMDIDEEFMSGNCNRAMVADLLQT